ncbi:MAG: D-aminoacylase [Wenzhouxiangellaceae bacterium]|nr:D-aminoacylase [Wenzhouxiangellaceae bacterium]
MTRNRSDPNGPALVLLSILALISWNGGPLGATASGAESVEPRYDVVILDGLVYDGLGGNPVAADVAIREDRIAALGEFDTSDATTAIDATGMAVAPGFINMLSWATETLIEDGRGLSDLRQGVTLEVFGEGWSMGPLNDAMKDEIMARQGDIRFDVEWDTLGGYLEYLEARGISPNVASFVGATTIRMHELGEADRAPSPDELGRMQARVAEAMREGALGVGSSLIYAPGFYADTDELVALAATAAEYGGSYISHMRSEGNRLVESVQELIEIARRSGASAEIYHLKAAGRDNWDKLERVFELVENARDEGLDIRADMYNYTAGATGLDAAMPPWVQEGGHDAWVQRLRDPEIRERVLTEIRTPGDDWENLYLAAGGAENLLFFSFKSEELKPLTGKTLAEVAAMRGTSPERTMIDLVIEDDSRVGTIYFLMSEENVARKIAKPWMAFGSDAGAYAPEGVFLKSSTHPRAYGNVARLLGKYVREQRVITLAEAVRRLTSYPAANLKLRDRGRLAPGYYADIVVFDPDAVQDHATFEDPHRLATGVRDVFVNGEAVLRDAEHTGATPGRVARGPGWIGWTESARDMRTP